MCVPTDENLKTEALLKRACEVFSAYYLMVHARLWQADVADMGACKKGLFLHKVYIFLTESLNFVSLFVFVWTLLVNVLRY